MIGRRGLLGAGVALGVTGLRNDAAAQDAGWPSRPVRIINPFAPGASHDVLVRILGEQLQQRLGQPFVSENRTGAGGSIGSEVAARSAPDGYSIYAATIGTLTINEHLYARLPYDPGRDFVPSTLIWEGANCLFVSAEKNPARTLPEFIAWARAQRRELTFSSAGAGTTPHLAGEMFKARIGIPAQHVPYREGSQRVLDLVSGALDFSVDNVATYTALLREGKLRAIAVASAERWPTLPEVPTMAEAGLADFVVPSWGAFAFPTGTPAPIVAKLAGEVKIIAADPAVQRRFLAAGGRAVSSTPEETARFVAAERQRWGEVVRAAAIRVE
ncbi:Bug family tripartite tricarboxylate transporter substrate binding protein [Falsiroseomonas sp. HW251]|uniref:Bug family tripartite tricarboxylate transporter substrate binding protein n=1 Tax=Falsiroseomonas sp. HW251 TaxID=3390998 RepID=UPI003D31DF67